MGVMGEEQILIECLFASLGGRKTLQCLFIPGKKERKEGERRDREREEPS